MSRFIRMIFPKNEFKIEQKKEDVCVFTASGAYRVGWIGKTFFNKAIEKGLSSVKKHMQEEGENLKRLIREN